MSSSRVWTIEIVLTEEGDVTRADAILEAGTARHRGWGHAKRNPEDDDVPRIGAEIAVARALEDLVKKLIETAEHDVTEQTGEQAHIHL